MTTIEYSRVLGGGAGWTSVELPDGSRVTIAGDRATRNNNPGNIEYGGFARRHGAIGTDGRFAVFPSREAGIRAQAGLIFGGRYANKTLREAIAAYAPDFENNTAAYQNRVAQLSGVSLDTKMKDIPADQRAGVLSAFHAVEGNTRANVLDDSGTVIGTIQPDAGLTQTALAGYTGPSSVGVDTDYSIGDPTANAGPAGQAYADLVKPTSVKTTGAALQPSMPEAKVAANGFAPGLVPASYTEPAPALSPQSSPALAAIQKEAPANPVQISYDVPSFTREQVNPIAQPTQAPIQTTERVVGTEVTNPGLPKIGSIAEPAPVQTGLLSPTPVASQPAPALSPPKTIADAPTIAAPQQQPEQQNTFPAAPPTPKDESVFGPRMKGALLGGAVAGLPGAVVGGLLGGDLGGLSGLGGMLGNGPVGPALAGERFNAGFGIPGIEAGMYGARGATGYSRSNPGAFTVSRGPNQGYDLTNQYGVTTPYDAQGHIMGNRQSLSRWGGLLGSMFGGGLLGGDRGGISDKERAEFAGRAGLY